jgi:Chaperone of endosialidase
VECSTAIGYQALQSNTTASGNTSIGFQALQNNATGGFNTAIGTTALITNTTGFGNVATGFQALHDNTEGGANAAIGNNALQSNTTGGGNTAIGNSALLSNTTGDSNTALGISAGSGITTATNVICIGTGGTNVNNSCFIGNIHGVTTATNDAIPVLIDSDGQLGTMNCSRRYKTDIKPMEKASESILALKPVSFRYKVHEDAKPQFGLIAEDVAQVNPDLVIYDSDGKPYTVRYDAVNAMLLNEFLKEHRRNDEQGATIARLQRQIEALTAGLQKVSAQLELGKPETQTVLKNH